MTPATPIELAKAPSFRLDGKRALVTGAGRGIGLAAASALAQAGAEVAVLARSLGELEETVRLIAAGSGRACAVTADVVDEHAVERAISAVAYVAELFGEALR